VTPETAPTAEAERARRSDLGFDGYVSRSVSAEGEEKFY
jgi:hypothetical protein